MKIHWLAGFSTMILMGIMMWSATSDLSMQTKQIIYMCIVVIGFTLIGIDSYRMRKKKKLAKDEE